MMTGTRKIWSVSGRMAGEEFNLLACDELPWSVIIHSLCNVCDQVTIQPVQGELAERVERYFEEEDRQRK